MEKINWDTLCSKCVFGTNEGLRTNAKGKCTKSDPKTQYVTGIGWVCESFTRRWDTKEDLEKSRAGT